MSCPYCLRAPRRSGCCTSRTRTWRRGSTASSGGSPRWRHPSSPTSSSTPATTWATPMGCAGLRAAFDPLRGIPGVFVHGSNDHAAPSPRNPLKYFTGPSPVKAIAEPLDTRALDGYFTDELGWVDLNNTVGSLDVGGARVDAFGVSDAHRHWDRLDDLPDPLEDLAVGRQRDRVARRHARTVPSRARHLHRSRRRHDLRRPHARRPGAPAGLRRTRGELRHPPAPGTGSQHVDARWPHRTAERQRGPRPFDLCSGALRLPARGVARDPPRRRGLLRSEHATEIG